MATLRKVIEEKYEGITKAFIEAWKETCERNVIANVVIDDDGTIRVCVEGSRDTYYPCATIIKQFTGTSYTNDVDWDCHASYTEEEIAEMEENWALSYDDVAAQEDLDAILDGLNGQEWLEKKMLV